MPPEEKCHLCRFYLGPQDGNGICRRMPPTVSIVLIPRGQVQMELVPTPVSSHPNASPQGWCGEFDIVKARILAS